MKATMKTLRTYHNISLALLFALVSCTFCSCKTGARGGPGVHGGAALPPAPMLMQPGPGVGGPGPGVLAYGENMAAYPGGPAACGPDGQGMNAFEAAQYGYVNPDGSWRPPGIAGPWPYNEYLRDGGDYITPATVRPDWSVAGVEQEDTIAHYDTLDGQTIVSPSNRVHIYAPRFGVVRRVDDVLANQADIRVAGVENPVKLNRHDESLLVTTAIQPVQPHGEIGTKATSIYRERQQGGGIEHRQKIAGFQDGFLAHEDFALIRRGIMDQADKARLGIAIDAAITWAHDSAVSVILDGQAANEVVLDEQVEVVYKIDTPKGPALRLVKVASAEDALPGETVDFTLRYDNVGVEPIGNVVIIDNLSTRLEYVAETQESDRDARFESIPNQGGSQALRWELTEPLEPGKGGIIRFRVKVK